MPNDDVTRDELAATEERVTDKVRTLHDRVDKHGERIAVVETKAAALEDGVAENRRDIAEQGAAVSELNHSLKAATGTFDAGVIKMEEAEQRRIDRLEANEEQAKSWLAKWRTWATPTNLVALLVIVSVTVALLKGEADRTDLERALKAASGIEIEAVEPEPIPEHPHPEPDEAAP